MKMIPGNLPQSPFLSPVYLSLLPFCMKAVQGRQTNRCSTCWYTKSYPPVRVFKIWRWGVCVKQQTCTWGVILLSSRWKTAWVRCTLIPGWVLWVTISNQLVHLVSKIIPLRVVRLKSSTISARYWPSRQSAQAQTGIRLGSSLMNFVERSPFGNQWLTNYKQSASAAQFRFVYAPWCLRIEWLLCQNRKQPIWLAQRHAQDWFNSFISWLIKSRSRGKFFYSPLISRVSRWRIKSGRGCA